MKVRLNQRTIDQAVYRGPGGCYLWDTEMPGFGLRIYPSGRKSFVVSYSAHGRRRFFTLGPAALLPLAQARTQALEVLTRARKGEDPSAERLAASRSPRMSDLADRHLRDHAEIKNKPRSARRFRWIWDRYILPKLGRRRVADIRRVDIAQLMTSLAETKAMANKVLTLLSKAFNLAEVWGWRPEGSNPCRHIQRFREEPRKRYLSESELRRLGEALDRAEQGGTPPQKIAAVRLLILTGCRSSEILQLRWDEVDLERRCLHLSDTKTGKQTVVLNTAALEVLAGIERVEGSPFVIPGKDPRRPLGSLQSFWNRLRVAADIADVRCHDLRHLFASIGINSGQSLSVIGKLLGHSKILTTQRYAHLADDPVRQASEQIGSTLAATLSGGEARVQASTDPNGPVEEAGRGGE